MCQYNIERIRTSQEILEMVIITNALELKGKIKYIKWHVAS